MHKIQDKIIKSKKIGKNLVSFLIFFLAGIPIIFGRSNLSSFQPGIVQSKQRRQETRALEDITIDHISMSVSMTNEDRILSILLEGAL